MIIAPNATDVSVYVKLIDPAAGTPETGLIIANLTGAYVRDRALIITSALTALVGPDSAHTDWYAAEVSAANAPGLYRVDYPDAAFAAGVGRVQLVVTGAAIDPAYLEVELSPWITLVTGAGVLVGATQGAVTWAQQKIVANIAGEGALDIENTNATGRGILTSGPRYGIYCEGTGVQGVGLATDGTLIGQENSGGNVGLSNGGNTLYGTLDTGAVTGYRAVGTTTYGIQAVGGTNETDIGLCDVWDCALAAHVAAGTTGHALNDIVGCTCGGGAIEFTYTVTDSGTGLPIEGVYVWVTTDIAGVNVIWSGYTDAFGVARDLAGGLPFFDVGDYYFWSQKVGYTFVNPDLEHVA